MSTGTTKSPALPLAPVEYEQEYVDKFNSILRLYFAQLDNPGASQAASLNFNLNTLPTQATLASMRSGEVYRDTTAGNVLKVKV